MSFILHAENQIEHNANYVQTWKDSFQIDNKRNGR